MKRVIIIILFLQFIYSNSYSEEFLKQITKILKKQDNLSQVKQTNQSYSDETSLVSLRVFPEDVGLNTFNWTVSWTTSPTNLAGNSWIGVYPYAQLSTSLNVISSFTIQGRLEGIDELPVPSEAGLYEIRYIQDNNHKAVSSIGPFYVNPENILIELSKTENLPGEKIQVKLLIAPDAWRDMTNSKANVYFCLNFVGDYDRCVWRKEIDYSEEHIFITLPTSAGYYVIRILEDVGNEHSYKKTKVISVSNIIRISHPSYRIVPESLSSVIASNVSASWDVDYPEEYDWVGLFSLAEVGLYIRKYPAIKQANTNGEKKGRINAILPPEKQAGPYIFIYFNEHRPVAVSEIINVQQPKVLCPDNGETMSKIKHLVIICTENHSFDSYFGNYCKGDTNSDIKCNYGPECCEKAPSTVDGFQPYVLNDKQNIEFDPNHNQYCELCEINSGRMDGYVSGCSCSDPRNFAVADEQTLKELFIFANSYALADRYFQPNAGASSQNDMYLARASYVFTDNTKIAVGSVGSNCWYLVHGIPDEYALYYNPIITSLLAKCGFTLTTYAEGYDNAAKNFLGNECYPNGYDSSDIPFNYYAGVTDNSKHIRDYSDLLSDLSDKSLPDVSFVKPLGRNTAHPSSGTITDEVKFIKDTVDAVLNSSYYDDTLVLWVPDESGGFYDHVSPPETNEVDEVPYGARIPMIAFGKFAKKNYISHVTMEHSSIVKFIEWNWLSGQTGQLNTRDRNVNGIGDIIDPVKAGMIVP